MLDALRKTLRSYEMLQPGDSVTCAVSGGADSMALLWAMYLLKDQLGIVLRAAHYNHGLRGEESDRDEAFVRDFCDRFDIPLAVEKGTVQAGKKGLEAAARDARYTFFETLPGIIATAHTADDNAETVLMHLVRGTGLKGLGGIAPVRGRIIRPMLNVTRQQVLTFLDEYHIAYVTDSSNDTDVFLRNRLRHHVMPLLKQENPRVAQNLSAMSQRLREDEQALSVTDDFSNGLEVDALLTMPAAMQNRTVAAFLKHCGVREPEAEHVALVRALALSANPSARADLPGAVSVCRRYDRLVLLEKMAAPQMQQLCCPGETVFGCTRVVCSFANDGQRVQPIGDVVVRSRQSGDMMRLAGGTKSLKKIFIDRKIPADRRSFVTVVADKLGVLAVEGFGYNLDRLVQGSHGLKIEFL